VAIEQIPHATARSMGLVITGDRQSMQGDTVMTQRSGMFLLVRREAYQQGRMNSASCMDRL
jgi:hypothetical protein